MPLNPERNHGLIAPKNTLRLSEAISVRSVLAGLMVIVLSTDVGWAQSFDRPLEEYSRLGAPKAFRFELEASQTTSGRLTIAGYIYNDYAFRVVDLQLLVEGMDSSGKVVSKTIGYVNRVPRLGVAYFEVVVPIAGKTYRVTVQSFDFGEEPEAP